MKKILFVSDIQGTLNLMNSITGDYELDMRNQYDLIASQLDTIRQKLGADECIFSLSTSEISKEYA